jgi:hypothetical protein
VECRQAGLLDGGDVNENIGAPAFRAYETKAFLRIEELHRTDRHDQSPGFQSMFRSFGIGTCSEFFSFIAFSTANRCALRRKML